MLAPIITKDMKLFPTRPLPPHVKNVRSRAQSLDQVNNGVIRQQTASRPTAAGPRPPKSQSTGNLPNVGTSPPKRDPRKGPTLPSIAEGVELKPRVAKSAPPRPNTSASTSSSQADADNVSTNSAPALDKEKEKKSVVKWITGAFKSKDKEEKKDKEDKKEDKKEKSKNGS